MKRLPKHILHVRIPPFLQEEGDYILNSLQTTAKEYMVIITFDAEDKTEMQIHSIIPNELSKEKANEIIELLKNLK